MLCDSTDASIAYTVAATGTITVRHSHTRRLHDRTDDGKTTVTFATGEQVRIRVQDHDGQMTISVKERIRCDSAEPDDQRRRRRSPADNQRRRHHDDGDHKGGDHGRGDHDDNDR